MSHRPISHCIVWYRIIAGKRCCYGLFDYSQRYCIKWHMLKVMTLIMALWPSHTRPKTPARQHQHKYKQNSLWFHNNLCFFRRLFLNANNLFGWYFIQILWFFISVLVCGMRARFVEWTFHEQQNHAAVWGWHRYTLDSGFLSFSFSCSVFFFFPKPSLLPSSFSLSCSSSYSIIFKLNNGLWVKK